MIDPVLLMFAVLLPTIVGSAFIMIFWRMIDRLA